MLYQSVLTWGPFGPHTVIFQPILSVVDVVKLRQKLQLFSVNMCSQLSSSVTSLIENNFKQSLCTNT